MNDEPFSSYPDVVTVQDLQKMLNISRNTAYNLINTNAIPYRKIGRIYRIQKSDIISFLKQ